MPGDLDLERLLAPLSPDAPSGRDLRYEHAFEALRDAATPGSGDIPGPDGRPVWGPKPRDFRKVRREALGLLAAGRDLRVLVWLAEALAVTDGPAGLAAGLELVRRNLEQHWDSLHPSLETEERDPADQAAARLNALRSLAAPEGMLLELARTKLVEQPGVGAVSLREWDLATGWSSPLAYEAKPAQSDLEIVLKTAPPAAMAERTAALAAAAGEVRSIEGVLAARVGDPGALPNLEPLAALIERMRALLVPYAPAVAETTAEPVDAPPTQDTADMASPGTTAAAPAAGGGALPVRLDSREDVLRALDLVVDYYRRREPGSPVPLVVERARRMVPMSFFDVMAELAPDSLARLKDLLGPKE
jgi:type VI secretion system protein ImpA